MNITADYRCGISIRYFDIEYVWNYSTIIHTRDNVDSNGRNGEIFGVSHSYMLDGIFM